MQTHLGVGESSKGLIDHGANRLRGESSNVWAKRPWGEKSPVTSCNDCYNSLIEPFQIDSVSDLLKLTQFYLLVGFQAL